MANFLPISIQFWEVTSSVSIMQMLAKQEENNIANAVEKADSPGAVKEREYQDEGQNEYGEIYTYKEIYYSCGSCLGLDYDQVKSEYKQLMDGQFLMYAVGEIKRYIEELESAVQAYDTRKDYITPNLRIIDAKSFL